MRPFRAITAHMIFDLPTLLVALTLTSGVLATAVLTVAWRAKVHQGLSLWGLGLVVNALSYPTFGLRMVGWVDTSIVLTNLFTALTLVAHTFALMAFQRGHCRAVPSAWVWLPTLGNLLAAWLLLHDDHWRNILASALQSVLAGVMLSQAWGMGLAGNRLTGRWVMITGTACLSLTLVARTCFMVYTSDWDGHHNVPDQAQALTYLATLVVLLTNSMGFVLMQMEHAIAQQHKLATHDGLTGAYNRHALLDALERHGAQAHRTQSPMAMLMIDIDHFKQVNDDHGHLVGDEVLREVTRRVERRLRRADMLARFGGEEFLALLPHTNAHGASVVAESIRQAMAERVFHIQGRAIPITVSVGVHAAIPSDAANATEAMIATSDQALYQAKHEGRNRIAVV
jgi:diguanylate cyclase (GGDEF)-like protein